MPIHVNEVTFLYPHRCWRWFPENCCEFSNIIGERHHYIRDGDDGWDKAEDWKVSIHRIFEIPSPSKPLMPSPAEDNSAITLY